MLAADEELAQTAIDEAAAGKERDRAVDEMAKAAGEITDGRPDKAIGHFRKAWQHATRD
jgi:hypothetical protein